MTSSWALAVLNQLQSYTCFLSLTTLWMPRRVCVHVYAHDDVIKWKYFSRNWPFVRRIHRSPVNSPQKGQWRGALIVRPLCFDLRLNKRLSKQSWCWWLRRHRAHHDVIVMPKLFITVSASVLAPNPLGHMSVMASQITDHSTVLFNSLLRSTS